MQKEDIIRKVQALLKMAAGAVNEHEAQCAAMWVRELLSKYNVNMTDVGDVGKSDFKKKEFILTESYFPTHIKALFASVEGIYAVRALCETMQVGWSKKRSMVLFGQSPDFELAIETINYLKGFAKRKAKEYGYTSAKKNDYVTGFYIGAGEKLQSMQTDFTAQENALVLIKNTAVNAYIDELYPEKQSRTVTARESTVFHKGYFDGRSINTDKQINA